MGSVIFSSSYSVPSAGSATYNVRVSYSESYSQSANRTTLAITGVELQKEGNTANWGSLPFFGSVSVNGTTLLTMSGGSSVRVSLSGGGYCPVAIPASGSVEIEHEADGSKTVSFTLTGGFSYHGSDYFCGVYNSHPFGVTTQAKSVALTPHARASLIASCPSSVSTLSALNLSVTRGSSAFYHKASFSCSGRTLYTSGAFATSLSFTVPREWFSYFTSAACLTVGVSVQTYTSAACTTAVGSPATASVTVTADAGMKPAVSAGWVTLCPYNTGPVAAITGYVKGYSQAEASFDASLVSLADTAGASLASFCVTCQGASDSAGPYRTPVLTSASVAVLCTVTDSRGRSASESFTLTVMDYARPVIGAPEVFRCDASGNAAQEGGYCSVRAGLIFSSLGGQNTCTLCAAYTESGGSYGAQSALQPGEPALLGPLSADASYTVRISATDALGNTAVYYQTIPTRKWAMKFRPDGSGVAFGKAAEFNGRFQIAADWSLYLGDDRIAPVLHITTPDFSTLPVTFYSPRITSAHRIPKHGAQLSNASAVAGSLGWTTADGSITFSGTISGTTNVSFDLQLETDVTVT